jgi:pilus assembly protein Flp/PilA
MRLRSFIRNEDGVSLTEYLVLLGLLTAGTITGTVSFGVSLSDAWRSASNVVATISAPATFGASVDTDEPTATIAASLAQEPEPTPAANPVAPASETKTSTAEDEGKGKGNSGCLPSQASSNGAKNSGKCQ